MSRRRLALLATLALVATAGCLGFLGGGGGGSGSIVVDSADGAVYVQATGGASLPAGTAINVTVAGSGGSQILTLEESVASGERVYVGGDGDLTASVGERPATGDTTCDLTIGVDTGDRTVTRTVESASCPGSLGWSVEIATEPAEGATESARYVYVRPTGGTTLGPDTRLNVTLEITLNGQTRRDTLETTLNRSVEAGTKVYLADDGGDLAVLVGEVDDSVTVVRPNELPATLAMTVTVEGEETTTRTLTFEPEDDGSEGG